MEDFDHIDFTAASPALGVPEPKVISDLSEKDLESPKISKKTVFSSTEAPGNGLPWTNRALHGLKSIFLGSIALLVDHLLIIICYGLLSAVSYLLLGFSHVGAWLSFLSNDFIFFTQILLFITVYGFYFLFFTKFKTSTPGRWMVRGDL